MLIWYLETAIIIFYVHVGCCTKFYNSSHKKIARLLNEQPDFPAMCVILVLNQLMEPMYLDVR